MRKIYAITDYKGHFGSKWLSLPYRSGYDQRKLQDYFKDYGLSLEFKRPIEIHFSKEEWNGKTVLLTSSEEPGLEKKCHSCPQAANKVKEAQYCRPLTLRKA
jgi:hypothetical protein